MTGWEEENLLMQYIVRGNEENENMNTRTL